MKAATWAGRLEGGNEFILRLAGVEKWWFLPVEWEMKKRNISRLYIYSYAKTGNIRSFSRWAERFLPVGFEGFFGADFRGQCRAKRRRFLRSGSEDEAKMRAVGRRAMWWAG